MKFFDNIFARMPQSMRFYGGICMIKRESTLKDVARLSGVSVGTVSKYINNPGSVKEKNRKIIGETVKMLKYTPNTLAQRLAKGKSNTVLLYISVEPDIGTSTWLHDLPFIQAINDYLKPTDYSLQIKIGSIGNPEETFEYIRNCIFSRNIDGVAIASAWTLPKKLILGLLKEDFPFVLIDNHNPLINSNDITADNRKMVEDIVDYLADLGHKKIGFISVDSDQQHINDRLGGFRSAMERHGFGIDDRLILNGDYEIQSGYRCVDEMLSAGLRPTALIGGNDNMAVGAIKAIKRHGLSVPGDISVVGIDNSIVAQACDPVLTTMSMPVGEIGRIAIENLLNRIENNEYEIRRVILSCSFVHGESTCRAKDA